jgi:hypothetical protein
MPQAQTGEMPYIQHRHFGAVIASLVIGVSLDKQLSRKSGPVARLFFAQNRPTTRLKLSTHTLRRLSSKRANLPDSRPKSGYLLRDFCPAIIRLATPAIALIRALIISKAIPCLFHCNNRATNVF